MKKQKLLSALILLTGLIVMPLALLASTSSDFTNTGAPTATFSNNTGNGMVMNIDIPDAWNAVAYTADTLMQDGSAAFWQGDTLNAFPALGTTSGVGFEDIDVGNDYDNVNEAVVRDLDADSVYTSAADTLIIDNADTPSAGDALHDVVAGDRLCADNTDPALATRIWTSTADGADVTTCTADDTVGVTYIGAPPAADTLIVTGDNWATTDVVLDGTTDIYKENVAEELTYSSSADIDVYTTGNLITGDPLIDFPADCDGTVGPGTQACKYTGSAPIDSTEDILIDGGTAGGVAPNGVVDRQDDEFNAITFQNMGTAVNATDISIVRVWADDGSGVFGPGDALLGVPSWDGNSWDLAGFTWGVTAGGQRLFVTVNIAAAPTNGRTIIMNISQLSDGATSGSYDAGDLGVFMASNNDGPTDAAIANANTQTIDSIPPTFAATTVTDDVNNDGTVDQITINFSEPIFIVDDAGGAGLETTLALGDGCTIPNANYSVSSVTQLTLSGLTGCTPNDTGITPSVTYTSVANCAVNGAICDVPGNQMNNSETINAADGAAPVPLSADYQDLTGNGVVDQLFITFSADTGLACTYEGGDWSIPTPGSINASLVGSCAVVGDTINVAVSADANETGGITDPTIQYTNQGVLNQLKDGANNPVASFSGPLTATDGAGPVIISGLYSDSDSDGMVDRITLTYTENTIFTMAGADWNFSTPSTMAFVGDFAAAECVGTGTTTITCTDAAIGTFASDANETGISSGVQPAWQYATSTNVTDTMAIPNQAPNQTITLADNANPFALNATLDYNDNNKTNALVVNFTEIIDASISVQTGFHINDATTIDNVTLSLATASPDGASLTFPLTENERVAALQLSGVTGGNGGAAVLDIDPGSIADIAPGPNTNIQDDNNPVVETADTNLPTLNQWGLNYNTNQITLSFSETVDASTLVPTAITIQNAATATLSYTLTGGTTASLDGSTIVLDLTLTDVDALKAVPLLAKSTADAFLRTTALLIDDMGTNFNAAIVDGSALQASSVTGNGSYGDLQGSLLLTNNIINNSSKVIILFQVQNNLPVDGKIEIVFPAVFNVTGMNSIENLSNIDGTFSVVPTGQTVTITRLGDGTVVNTGANVSFRLVQAVNPSSLGLTPTFSFKTKNAANSTLDQDLTVPGQMIILPPIPISSTNDTNISSGGGGGGGFRTPKPAGLITKDEEAAPGTEEEQPPTAEDHMVATEETSAFEDTAGHWAETYISQMAALGIVSGKTATIFAPDDNISRAELLKIALGAFDYTVPAEVTEKPLSDVEIGEWYAPYVQAAFDNDLIYGFENGLEPNAAASRGMSATVLAKAAKFSDIDQHFTDKYSSHSDWTFAHFPDVLMNAYYAPFVAYLYDKGIIDGYEDGTFGPGNPITRAEIAKMVVKLLEIYAPAESEEPAAEESAEPAEEESASLDEEMMEGQGL